MPVHLRYPRVLQLRHPRVLCVALAALAAIVAGTSPGHAASGGDDEAVSVAARPYYSFEPGRVTLSVRHMPAAEHRRMTVEVESSDFFRSSSFPLEGDRSQRLHLLVLKALPAGDYQIHVTIDGDTASHAFGQFKVCHRRPGMPDRACDPPDDGTDRRGRAR